MCVGVLAATVNTSFVDHFTQTTTLWEQGGFSGGSWSLSCINFQVNPDLHTNSYTETSQSTLSKTVIALETADGNEQGWIYGSDGMMPSANAKLANATYQVSNRTTTTTTVLTADASVQQSGVTSFTGSQQGSFQSDVYSFSSVVYRNSSTSLETAHEVAVTSVNKLVRENGNHTQTISAGSFINTTGQLTATSIHSLTNTLASRETVTSDRWSRLTFTGYQDGSKNDGHFQFGSVALTCLSLSTSVVSLTSTKRFFRF